MKKVKLVDKNKKTLDTVASVDDSNARMHSKFTSFSG